MITNSEMSTFLRDGLSRYAEARDAVETFEREIQERLVRLLEEKRDWQAFRPKHGARGRGKLGSGVWRGGEGRTIYAYQYSQVENDGWVDLKLWWGSPRGREGVLLCCGRYDSNYRVRSIELPDPKGGIVCKPIHGNGSHLYVAFDQDSDLDALGRLLLDEMDRALHGGASTR